MKKPFLIFTLLFTLFMAKNLYAQDWQNLAKYHDDNAKLPPPAKGEKRVVFMGNSITEGWLKEMPEFFAGKPYIDRGIGGQVTGQMLLRFRVDVIALQPTVVVILAGTNDIAGNNVPDNIRDDPRQYRFNGRIGKSQ
ncbi:GDSL-type esterase/lipase family protein [Flavobacterium sp. 3HN19-14]|uniref:GDSL-type esterase/lipase family protein n=1 Tax=Flavobacterium sp. 3HN19-14 TaxID=3448133 RepID=UPI003EDEA934